MYRFVVLLPLLTFIASITVAPSAYGHETKSNFINNLDESTKSFSSLTSHVQNFFNIQDTPTSNAQAFSIVSAVKEGDLDTEPADVFVPFAARQVQQTLPPVVQNPTLCTFPELFRRNTLQRSPRNTRLFRRFRSDTIVQFNMLYLVSNGVAIVRITPLRNRILRRVGVVIRIGGFTLTRQSQVQPKMFIRRNDPTRLRFQRSFDYSGVSDLRRSSRFASCCGRRLTVNMFIRICQLVPRNRPRRGIVFREVCRTRLVQPRPSRLFCRRL